MTKQWCCNCRKDNHNCWECWSTRGIPEGKSAHDPCCIHHENHLIFNSTRPPIKPSGGLGTPLALNLIARAFKVNDGR